MEPEQEVFNNRKKIFEFQHTKDSKMSIYYGRPPSPRLATDNIFSNYLTEHLRCSIRSFSDIRDWILSQPDIKGTLIDNRYRVKTEWIFRPAPPRICCDNLFWKIFDRSKLGGRAADFKEFLWNEIRDCYITHDNPNTDPLQGNREKILSNLLPLFRVVNLKDRDGWKPVLIDKLPDPTLGRPISQDTLNRYIQALQK